MKLQKNIKEAKKLFDKHQESYSQIWCLDQAASSIGTAFSCSLTGTPFLKEEFMVELEVEVRIRKATR